MKINLSKSAIAMCFVLGGTVLAGTPAAAHGHKSFDAKMLNFSVLDADNSGSVSAEELKAVSANRFDKSDANGDGQLTAQELTAKLSEMMAAHGKQPNEEKLAKKVARMIEKHDQNGDGQLSKAEMKPKRDHSERIMKRFDENNDGQLSKEEFEAFKAKMQKRMGKRHGKKDEDSAS